MKIVVTGAAGRLGLHVARKLADEGKSVVGLDLVPAFDGAWICGDIRDPAFCREHLASAEAIIHLSGNLDANQAAYEDNTTMNANVFGTAAEFGVRKVIFASSIQTIGWGANAALSPWGFIPSYLPLDENSPLQPATPYARSKAEGENLLGHYCQATGGCGIALRLPRLMTAKDYQPWSEKLAAKGHLWIALSYLDTARLISDCLAAELSGRHTYLPAGPDVPWGPGREEFLDRHYPTVPRHIRTGEMPGLVECRTISAETGWRPLSWEEQF